RRFFISEKTEYGHRTRVAGSLLTRSFPGPINCTVFLGPGRPRNGRPEGSPIVPEISVNASQDHAPHPVQNAVRHHDLGFFSSACNFPNYECGPGVAVPTARLIIRQPRRASAG